ncbi:MAG: cytochrome c [Pseudomonadota bacterium]
MRSGFGMLRWWLAATALFGAVGLVNADDRALRLTTLDGVQHSLTIAELDERVGVVTRDIPLDFHFKANRRFVGYDLRTLLKAYGLPTDDHYELICEDGYIATLTPEQINNPNARALVARADLAAPEGDRWDAYHIGERKLSFDPFYMVWSPQTEALSPEALIKWPWPYALVGIRPVNTETQFAAATPTEGAASPVTAGFRVFRENCSKCHAVNGAGGKLGPSLTDSPFVSYFPKPQLVEMIADIGKYYADSKMPSYGDRLSAAELETVADYLRFMAGASSTEASAH